MSFASEPPHKIYFLPLISNILFTKSVKLLHNWSCGIEVYNVLKSKVVILFLPKILLIRQSRETKAPSKAVIGNNIVNI